MKVENFGNVNKWNIVLIYFNLRMNIEIIEDHEVY